MFLTAAGETGAVGEGICVNGSCVFDSHVTFGDGMRESVLQLIWCSFTPTYPPLCCASIDVADVVVVVCAVHFLVNGVDVVGIKELFQFMEAVVELCMAMKQVSVGVGKSMAEVGQDVEEGSKVGSGEDGSNRGKA